MNACTNCIDRHIPTKGDQVALIWESDEQGVTKSYTYKQLLAQVSKCANAMLAHGVKRVSKCNRLLCPTKWDLILCCPPG